VIDHQKTHPAKRVPLPPHRNEAGLVAFSSPLHTLAVGIVAAAFRDWDRKQRRLKAMARL
jgi:hypothetical protein